MPPTAETRRSVGPACCLIYIILGPAHLIPIAAEYFQDLDYDAYPAVITQAITEIVRGTAVTYSVPHPIVSDLQGLTAMYNCSLHCIVSQFRVDANEHIFTIVPTGRLPPLIYSPEIFSPVIGL